MEKVSYCEARKELRAEIKELVNTIKPMKTKEYRREHQEYGSPEKSISHKIRHLHIAFCLLRGKTYEQIEQKVRKGNEPSWYTINNILSKYESLVEYNERKKSDNYIDLKTA